jgi:membrane protease YdiL (CAAX protease family)
VLVRAQGLVVTAIVLCGLATLTFAAAAASPHASGAASAISAVIAAVAAGTAARLSLVGFRLEANQMTLRSLTSTDRVARAEVAGLAVQPAFAGGLRRLALVCTDGRVLPAVWAISRASVDAWDQKAAWLAAGFGDTQAQVPSVLQAAGRYAGTAVMPRVSAALPLVTPDPVLSPATVSPVEPADSGSRWLGWEMTFVVAAFALPGIAGAVEILAKHLGGVSDLNEFDLPLPHNPAASLPILIFGYFTTALVVPIALLLLARTGQPPSTLGLERRGWRRDLASSAELLAAVWVTLFILTAALNPLIDNKHLTNTETNSHVPAYYILYALAVSATTAINEEVLVNGYFVTRLTQRGWSPWRTLALSLAVRTSYHAYYGIGFILTIPLGYIVTRSFQKRQRLARPILVHFTYDAILLIIAVLTS